MSGAPIYEFGPFRLDRMGRLLRRNSEIVPLTPKTFDTLLVLVENAGQLVGKERLIETVWQDTIVEEGNLTYTISMLRKALGNDWQGVPYIRTIPKRGYQFAVPVVVEQFPPDKPDMRRWIGVAAALSLTLIAAIAVAFTGSHSVKARFQAQDSALQGKERLPALGGFKDSRREREQARQAFETALRKDKNSAEAHAGLALVFEDQYHHGDAGLPVLHEAIRYARQALALDPGLIDARRALIRIYHSTGQTEEGLEQARLVLAIAPRQREALDAAGEAYFRVGMIDRALPLYQRALDADPLSPAVRQAVARCYFHTGEYQKGIDTVKPLFGEGTGSEWIGMLLYSELGQFDEAIALGKLHVERTPTSASGWWELGRVYLAAGRTVEAGRVWKQGIAPLERHAALANNPRTRTFLASIYAMLGERSKALEHVERARQTSRDAWVLFEAALVHAMLADDRESIEQLREAVEHGYRGLHYLRWEMRHPYNALYRLRNDPDFQTTQELLEKKVRSLYVRF